MVRYSREVWFGHVAAMNSCGQSAVSYAAEHDLPLRSLYQWRSKLKSSQAVARPARPLPVAMSDSKAQQFISLRVAPEVVSRAIGHCSLVFGPSLRLEMASLPDPSWLRALAQGDR